MSSISFTTSAAQDAIIQRELNQANALITAQNVILAQQIPPGTPIPLIASISAWVIQYNVGQLASIKQRQAADDLETAKARWFASTTTQQAAALAQLAVVP